MRSGKHDAMHQIYQASWQR